MAFALTEEQSRAVHDRGGGLLVSAAAGSGKTRVLVERLMDHVRKGADIDHFPIIPFPNAAAAELRDRIARAICQVFRRGGTVDTTRQLYALIEGALSFLPAAERKEAVKKSCQRTFQALRIDVNSEFEVLYAFLDKLPHVLKPGGRAAILTFHSGEDRLVKQAFRQQYRDGLYSDIAQEVTRPSPQECRRNPRAHSTKLRWAVRAE